MEHAADLLQHARVSFSSRLGSVVVAFAEMGPLQNLAPVMAGYGRPRIKTRNTCLAISRDVNIGTLARWQGRDIKPPVRSTCLHETLPLNVDLEVLSRDVRQHWSEISRQTILVKSIAMAAVPVHLTSLSTFDYSWRHDQQKIASATRCSFS